MDTQPTGHDITVIKSSERAVLDPVTGRPGYSSGVNLAKGATGHPVIIYKGKHGELVLVGDWFDCSKMNAPSYLNIYCPVCRNSLRISEDNKAISYDGSVQPRFRGYNEIDLLRGLAVPDLGGLISVEPFGCTWELEPELRRSYGFGVCNWRVSIDNNVARDV